MAGVPRAAAFVCLAILVCSYVAFSQDIPFGDSPQVGGQPTPDKDPILHPVQTQPVIQLIDDGPNPESCLGRCQAKCKEMPLDCEFIDDSLPVNCEDHRDECPDSCDSICECVDICEEACTIADSCKENCMTKCFKEHDFHPAGAEEVQVPDNAPPNSV